MFKSLSFLQRIAIVVGLCAIFGGVNANAATFSVINTSDSGPGTLRQAIFVANSNGEANVITFSIPTSDTGYNAVTNRFTIALLSALPDLPLTATTITNAQPHSIAIQGNYTFRIFTMVNGSVATFNNLMISNGNAADGMGGGIYMGDSSTLTMNFCEVSGNNVAGSGGGVYLSDSATLHLYRSTVRNNDATSGGAMYLSNSATLNMIGSTVNANAATNGGGIYNGTSATINTTSSTFDGNSAALQGGGIYNLATVTSINNTFASNSATLGGGIYNNFTATLINTIVATNTAVSGTDLYGGGGGGGAFTGVYNLIGNIDGSDGLTGATNLSGTTGSPLDPMLGPLNHNGGPTLTRVLRYGSPAIDQGNSTTVVTDQRGELNPVDNPMIPNSTGNGADIGSYEVQFAPTAAGVSLGGRVLIASGKSYSGLRNASVVLTDMQGSVRTVRTSSFGYFQFDDVETGETYILTVNSKQYTYSPRVITLLDELTDLEFIAHSTYTSRR